MEATSWPDRVEACRLERPDGTEWRVRALEVSGPEIRVDARRKTPEGARTLEDERLGPGDVVRWLDGEGRELWAMRVPGTGRSPAGKDRGPGGGSGEFFGDGVLGERA